MAILSKGWKPDHFESHSSLKFSFINIWGLCSNFVECESFLKSNSPAIRVLCETNLVDSTDSSNFSVRCYLSLIGNNSVTHNAWPCSQKRTSFYMRLISKKLCRFLFMFLTGFGSFSALLFSSLNHLLCLYPWFFMLFHLP